MAGASCFLHLSCVQRVHSKASHIFGTPKVRAEVFVGRDNRPVKGDQDVAGTQQLKMATRDPGPLAQAAAKALQQRAWERSRPAADSRLGLQDVRHPTGQPAQPSSTAHPGLGVPPGVNSELLQQLENMGFPHWRVVRGLMATNNAGPEQAVQWILENQGAPGVDDPVPGSQAATPQHRSGNFSTAAAGIAGILRREELLAAATDETMEQAFRDLRALMGKAQEMVAIAQRFRDKSAAPGTQGGVEEAMDADMETELISLGIASPVTRTTAGALYHQQLSRQLSDFLGSRLAKESGILALPDIYCLFNRARGTELVSPDDLLAAVRLFPSISAPMHLRSFDSGLLVVQSNSHSDVEVCRRLASMVPGPGLGPVLTAGEVATALSIPVSIAAEHLQTAEAAAVLCRDDGPDGLRFFRNFFKDMQPVA